MEGAGGPGAIRVQTMHRSGSAEKRGSINEVLLSHQIYSAEDTEYAMADGAHATRNIEFIHYPRGIELLTPAMVD